MKNHENQIKNLLEFCTIFLSGDLNITQQSPDYYLEKYERYINIPIKQNSKSSLTYSKWHYIWGENEDIKTIFSFFEELIGLRNPKSKEHWLVDITPAEMMNTFEKHIGNIEDINDIRLNGGMHFILKRDIYEKWVKRNIRHFKFLRILKEDLYE